MCSRMTQRAVSKDLTLETQPQHTPERLPGFLFGLHIPQRGSRTPYFGQSVPLTGKGFFLQPVFRVQILSLVFISIVQTNNHGLALATS